VGGQGGGHGGRVLVYIGKRKIKKLTLNSFWLAIWAVIDAHGIIIQGDQG
jgi:hypothetical protein